ncbi:beta-lactamase-like protein [Trichophaea hybrida]|nr:beta-lactamase-like protein [Trichophaea hybrida]
MKVHAEILTAASSDTPGTIILLHFDSKRYVFGQFAEGSQRAFMERHVRLSKVRDLFLTGPVEWKNTGGLVGIMLAMGDPDGTRTEQQRQAIYGGENLLYTLSTMRRFVFRTGMNLSVNEIQVGAPDFVDENVVIRTLHVQPDDASVKEPDCKSKQEFLGKAVNDMFCSSWTMNTMVDDLSESEILDGGEDAESERNPQLSTKLPPKGKTRAPWPASTIESLPDTSPNTVSLCYILHLHEQRGKFLPALAKKLGVKPGPDFSRLSRGESITTPDGKVVRPEDVMEPSREGTGIAICDLPNPAYLSNFVAASEWADIEAVQRRIGSFFWIVAGTVISDPRFQEFVSKFPNSKHIVSSMDVCSDRINFKAAAKSAVLLNSLDPELFPEPRLDCSPRLAIDTGVFDIAIPGLQWQLEPKWHLNTKTVEQPFNRQDIAQSEALCAAAKQYQETISTITPSAGAGHDIEIFTLGTGSSLPSRHRNVSSTLVRIPGVGNILLDCGEGTLGQLKRLFSHEPGGLNRVLTDLKAIYISHLHADHHLGTTSILGLKRSLQKDEKIHVVAPRIFHTWLKEYSCAEPGMDKVLESNIISVLCEELQTGSNQLPAPESLLHTLHLTALETAPAIHCLSSFCVSFTFTPYFKLSYSGDTRPNDSFVGIGADSTVLIHEATFKDDMVAQARAKKHCTVGEALWVGRDMGAQTVVLTHFSQRYPKLAAVAGVVEVRNVLLAFDCMRIKVGEAGRFALLKRGLEEIYREEEEEE